MKDTIRNILLALLAVIIVVGGTYTAIQWDVIVGKWETEAEREVFKQTTTYSEAAASFLADSYCQCCGWDGEIEVVEEDGKLMWRCPQCGNMDQTKMNVARRTCGYIGSQFWNQGRTQEIRDRVLHL